MSTNSATSLIGARIQFTSHLKEYNTTMYNAPYLLPSGSGLTGEDAAAGRNKFASCRKSTTKQVSVEMASYSNSPKKAKLLSRIVRRFAGEKSSEYEL